MLDLTLAVAHHILIFALAAVLATQAALVRPALAAAEVRRLAVVDRAYGGLAVLIIAVGVCRVAFGGKGWAFYADNPWFWAKLATFGLIGLSSIRPTMDFIRWSRALKAGAGRLPAPADVARTRAFILVQAALFPLLLLFAAAMARRFGL